jgi:hypothetical protein
VTAGSSVWPAWAMPEPVVPSETVTLAGAADATDDTTVPTAWIVGLAAAASPAVAEATPEPPVSTWVVPLRAVPAAATVAVTADTGFWPA